MKATFNILILLTMTTIQAQSKMKIEQIYTGCMAHAAYYLESEGEVKENIKSLKKAKKPVLAVSVYDEESLDAVRKQLLTSLKP